MTSVIWSAALLEALVHVHSHPCVPPNPHSVAMIRAARTQATTLGVCATCHREDTAGVESADPCVCRLRHLLRALLSWRG